MSRIDVSDEVQTQELSPEQKKKASQRHYVSLPSSMYPKSFRPLPNDYGRPYEIVGQYLCWEPEAEKPLQFDVRAFTEGTSIELGCTMRFTLEISPEDKCLHVLPAPDVNAAELARTLGFGRLFDEAFERPDPEGLRAFFGDFARKVQACIYVRREYWSDILKDFDPLGHFYKKAGIAKINMDGEMEQYIEPANLDNIIELDDAGLVKHAQVQKNKRTALLRKNRARAKAESAHQKTQSIGEEAVPQASAPNIHLADKEQGMNKTQDSSPRGKLVYVPFEERHIAQVLGLRYDGKMSSWVIPEDAELEVIDSVLSRYSIQTPEEALERANALRETDAYAAYREEKKAKTETRAKGKLESHVEEKTDAATRTESEEAKVSKTYLDKKIPPYARLYLAPRKFSEEERAELKCAGVVFDGEHGRWCIDRRRARMPGAVSSLIPDYRAVPFEDKDEAKSLGAKWDYVQRSWYIPAGFSDAQFARWPKLSELPCRDYITVPKEDRAEAESLGAMHDANGNYYIPKGEDRSVFAKWSPSAQEPIESRPDGTAFEKAKAEERRRDREAEREAPQQTNAQGHARVQRLSR